MTFLAGQGIYDKGSEFREVNEGAGRADVIRVESGGVKRLFELKVISDNVNRFEEGFNQLFFYTDKEHINTSFYLVFESRSSSKRTSLVEQQTNNGKKVTVIVIDLVQLPPTRC